MPAKTAGGLITKAFTISEDDIALIQSVKAQEGMRSESAALRRLLQDAAKYRGLMNAAETQVAKDITKSRGQSSGLQRQIK